MSSVTFIQTDARLSETARCARITHLRMNGAEGAEPDQQTQRYFRRGHLFESYVRDQLVERFSEDDVEEQRDINWPLGVGHADLFVRSERLLIEVVSTVSPSPKMLGWKIEQLKQYLHYDPEAEHGAVYVINPSSLDGEQILPVTLTDEDRDRITTRVAMLDTGELPDRVCRRPSDARSMMCPFSVECFDGWQATPLEEFGEELDGAVAELERAEDSYRTANANLKEIKKERDQARRMVREYVDLDREYVSSDGVRVKVIEIQRTSYDIDTAIETSVVDAALVEPFKTTGNPHERWYVKRLREQPSVSVEDFDYGEEAPF